MNLNHVLGVPKTDLVLEKRTGSGLEWFLPPPPCFFNVYLLQYET